MPRNFALVLTLAIGISFLPELSFAQLTPPAGAAGVGNTPTSGVPFGPANPRALSDPSGIGNASLVPPLRSNFGAQSVPSPPLNSLPASRPSAVAPLSAVGSQRIINPREAEPRDAAPVGRRGRAAGSTFKGICRGC